MNWYKKFKLQHGQNISEKDINNLLNKEILTPKDINLIKNLPENIKLREENNQKWSLIRENEGNEQVISFDEPTIEHALRGGGARLPILN